VRARALHLWRELLAKQLLNTAQIGEIVVQALQARCLTPMRRLPLSAPTAHAPRAPRRPIGAQRPIGVVRSASPVGVRSRGAARRVPTCDWRRTCRTRRHWSREQAARC
jgi:hypothetical protein